MGLQISPGSPSGKKGESKTQRNVLIYCLFCKTAGKLVPEGPSPVPSAGKQTERGLCAAPESRLEAEHRSKEPARSADSLQPLKRLLSS